MADRVPPVLPPSNSVTDWAEHYGAMIGGIIAGGPAVGAAAASGAAGAAIGQKAAEESKAAGGGPLSADFWHRVLSEIEVYGFLFLLVGIGLYGLFAPSINVAVGEAGKVIAPEVAGPKEVGRRVGHAIRKRVRK